MEAIREQLKLSSRQYNLYMKNVVALQNNLISLTDKVFPGVNELFSSPDRADGSQKWVDFVMTVKSILGDFPGIRLVCLHLADGAASALLDEQRVYHRDME